MVEFTKVTVESKYLMPTPPPISAVFPETVVRSIVTSPRSGAYLPKDSPRMAMPPPDPFAVLDPEIVVSTMSTE